MGRMNTCRVTDYLYTGSRVGKEHAHELNAPDSDPNASRMEQVPPEASENCWQKRQLL
jgi:hypothetical protein